MTVLLFIWLHFLQESCAIFFLALQAIGSSFILHHAWPLQLPMVDDKGRASPPGEVVPRVGTVVKCTSRLPSPFHQFGLLVQVASA
jgi:hypothetical protein